MDDLKRSSAVSITFDLFVLGLIDSTTYLNLRKIIVERNKLIHPQKKGVGFQHSKEEEQKRRAMLQKAQKLIEKLAQIKI